MLSSTDDDDDDASWSNLGAEETKSLRRLPSLVDESDDFSCGRDDVDDKMGTDAQHVPCDDKRELISFSVQTKEAHKQNLEDIEDAWEDKEEDVKKWLELAEEQQFDAKKRMISTKEKKAGRHPYNRKGSKCVSSPRKLRRRRDAATPTTKEREEE